jgi:hypothetical protein
MLWFGKDWINELFVLKQMDHFLSFVHGFNLQAFFRLLAHNCVSPPALSDVGNQASIWELAKA